MAQKNSNSSGQYRYGIAFKMITAIVIILIIVAGIQIAYSYQTSSQNIKVEAEHTLGSYYLTYQTKIEAEQKAAEALAISIANRPDVRELYLAGDQDGLFELLAPMFDQWKERQIVHLYIENPDGTVFLRVHNRASFGDNITYRGTAQTALLEKRTTSGVEIGPSRLGVRAVTPMYASSGEFIGLVEVGMDFDEKFVTDLKKNTGADFTMWVTYEAAAIPNLKPAEGVPQAPIKDLFYYAGTNTSLPTANAEVYQAVLDTGEPQYLVINDDVNPTIIYVTQLLGYDGKLFGIIQFSESYIPNLKLQNQALLSTLGVVGGLTVISLFLIWLLTSRFVLRPLAVLTQFAQKQTSGETSARVSLNSDDEFEQVAETFNILANNVEQERRDLEKRVADRTKALTTSTDVSRRLSTILDQRQLVTEVVELVQAAFNYYHAHIYILDEATGDLIMAGGTGEAGAAMLARGHKVPKGRGLVGRAAATNEPVLVADVSQAEGWLPNPLLPETRSEAAIPISSGKQVLGVLDVQQNIVNGLNEADVILLQSLAGQVSISLQNARSFEQSKSQADLESLVNTIGQKIQRTTSVEDTLQTAIRELGLALGASRVAASIHPNRDAVKVSRD